MAHFRQSNGQITLFILSLIGTAIAIYLTIVHYNTHVTLVCSSKGLVNCEHTLSSPYASIPGISIPVSIAGILWSNGGAALAVYAWDGVAGEERKLSPARGGAAGGMFSAFRIVHDERSLLHY